MNMVIIEDQKSNLFRSLAIHHQCVRNCTSPVPSLAAAEWSNTFPTVLMDVDASSQLCPQTAARTLQCSSDMYFLDRSFHHCRSYTEMGCNM